MIKTDCNWEIQVEEFPEDSPSNLDNEDQAHWARIRQGTHFVCCVDNTLSTSQYAVYNSICEAESHPFVMFELVE